MRKIAEIRSVQLVRRDFRALKTDDSVEEKNVRTCEKFLKIRDVERETPRSFLRSEKRVPINA